MNKYFLGLILWALLNCVVIPFINAQGNFPDLPVAVPGSTRATVDITIRPIGCRLVTTNVVIGYSAKAVPIFQNTCQGICLSVIFAPRECRPIYSYISVATKVNPLARGNNFETVRQVVGCNCLPRRCKIVRDGIDVYYNHGATVIDNCERRCTCSYGTLINCCRQRKEFRLGLTTAEKERYINAVKLVSTTPPYKATYDALIQKHQSLFSSGIHSSSLFFPWHREYIWDLENLLQQVDCRVTVPFWRWSLEAANPFASIIWANANSGFGGNGSPPGNCINTGPFAPPWQTSELTPQCLRRNWNTAATFATEADITQTLDVTCPLATQYNCLRINIESYHNYVHSSTGGQMGTTVSSNDPIFFMHHTYIDRIWARWQAKSPAHITAYSGVSTTTMPGSSYTPADWFDLTKQQNNPANRVCYIDPQPIWWVDSVLSVRSVNTKVDGTSGASDSGDIESLIGPEILPNFNPLSLPCTTPERLQSLPRVPLQPFPASWIEAMRMDERSVALLRALHNQRNNASIYNLIDVDKARQTPGVTASLGFYLYDEDYSCIDKQIGEVKIESDEVEPPYSPYEKV